MLKTRPVLVGVLPVQFAELQNTDLLEIVTNTKIITLELYLTWTKLSARNNGMKKIEPKTLYSTIYSTKYGISKM